VVAFSPDRMNAEEWARLSELFHHGLQRSGPERDRLIAEKVQDTEIAAELRKLWEHADPTGFLQRPLVVGTIRDKAAEETGPLASELPSKIVLVVRPSDTYSGIGASL
jgi:hypothetical protein